MPMRLDDFVSQTSTEPAVPDTKNGLEPAKGTRLDDYVSMMPVPAQEPLIEFSDEWREEQKAKGEIGYIETLRRKRKLEMLPAVPAVNSVFLLNAAKRWRRNQYDDDKQKEEDKELLSRFLEKKEEERIRGFSLGGHVARGQVELPAYMLEFALTGGVASLGRAAAAKGVTALATKTAGAEAIKSLAGRATLETAELAASAAVRTTVLPHKWVGSFADRQLNSGLELTEKGIQIADQIGEKPMTSFAKAIGDTYIEFASEETGGMITKGLGKLVPKQFKTALEKLWVRSKPNRTVETVKALWTKAGYHSFIGELGEEQVGDLMRAITGVEDFGAKDPDNMWDRVAKSWHGVDELLVNAGVLALPGGARMASVQLANLIQKRKRMTMTEGPPLQELTDAQADQIMAKKGAGAEEKTGEEGTPPSPQKIAKAQSLDRMIERAQDTTDPLSSELAPLLEDMKLARQQLGEIQPKAQEEVQPPPEAKPEPIGETIKKRLLEAGVSGEVADSQSKLYEASFQTMSERAGIDAVELFNRYGPQITRVDGPTENVPPGTMTAEEFEQASFNALLEKQRQTEGMSAAIKDPQTGELYTGPSHAEILEEAFKTDADLAGRLSEELLNRTENTGFADENLEFVSRQQAERRFGIVNSESLRKSYQQGPAKTSESNAHENKVLTTFGETDDLKKAGFLFPDGKMADFTEKGEERRYTHYDAIEKVLGDENRLYEFLSLTKAVRVVYYSDINGDNVSFQSTAPFTQDQLRQINDYLISNKVAHSNLELVTETGKQIRTKAVDNTAIADIERFFNGSSLYQSARHEQPKPSATAMPAGAILYHGTSAEAFTTFRGDRGIFLTDSRLDAKSFAENDYLGGGGGKGTRRIIITQVMKDSRVKDISEDILEPLMEGEVEEFITEQVAKARSEGYGFVYFLHPSTDNENDFNVWISVNPAVDLKTVDEKAARELEQSQGEEPRANIQFGDMGVLINLFKTADKSSILHETGHLYLKMMGELSALPTATEGLKTDAATLLKWLGAKSFEAIEREQHEKFARGFEAYLREGKAPTSELRQAFENFREWLLSIYKSIKDLKVELTPEVRGIFDRMLATQEEIEKSGLVTEERFKISELKKQMKDRDLDIQAFKQSIVDYANRYLYKEERGSLLATVKNAKTLTDLDQAVQRIDEMAETSAKETLLSKIETELEKTKVKKQSGKPVGTFTPDIQEILDSLRRFSSVDAFSAQEQIAKNLTAHADGVLPDEILLENKLLDLAGGLESKSSEDLAKVLETIKDIKRSGRALSELKDTERKKKISQAVDNFVKEITGQKGLASGTGTFGVKDVSKPETVAEAIKTFGRDLTLGWNDFLSILSGKSGVRSGQSFIELFGKVFNETRAEESAIGQANEKLRDMVSDSYGVKEEAKLLDILRESNRPVNLGRFTNAGGIEGDLVLTKAQAQKKWAELQDPSLKETFDSPEGMAYTQEIQDAIENFLSPEDKAFVKRAMKFFKEYYNTINPVYREMYGVNLPFNEFYTPIRRVDGGAETLGGFGEFIQEINVRRSVAPGGVKSRVKNIKPLELTSLPEVMQKHIAEMEHFKVWANKIRDLNAVFGNAKVKRAIQETYGSGLYKSVFNFIEDFTRGGSDKSKAIRFLDQWRIRTTQVALAARPAILIKQLASIPAYWDAMTTKDFTLGVLDFWKNPVENIKILKQSDFLKFRGQNIDRDIKAALDSEAYKAFRKTDSFINRLMLNVQLGDQGSIIVGGWAVYKRALNQGKTHEQALKEFAEVSNASQQSGDLSEQSGFQRGGSLAKMFTMFMTSPNQYLRKEMGAIRNYRNGRITAKEAAKTLFIFHFFLPMLFQWVSDFGRFDPKEQLRAAIFGSLNGLFIVGDLLEALLRRALGLKVYDNELPILSVPFKDIKDLLFSIDWHSIEDEDVKKALDGALGVTGFATRIPLKQVKDMLASVTDVYEGNYREGIGGMLGWSEHALKEKTDDESTSF